MALNVVRSFEELMAEAKEAVSKGDVAGAIQQQLGGLVGEETARTMVQMRQQQGSSAGIQRRYWIPSFNPPGGNLPSSGISAGPAVDALGKILG